MNEREIILADVEAKVLELLTAHFKGISNKVITELIKVNEKLIHINLEVKSHDEKFIVQYSIAFEKIESWL